jgi:hypothetical protein
MKIKEIVNEAGFWTGVKQAFTPKAMRLSPNDISKKQADDLATKLYGPNEEDWLTPDELANKNAPPPPPPGPELHPDVSVISSYPLRLKYKSGDYVLNPTTNQWVSVSGKRLAPELASFLQFQANKL